MLFYRGNGRENGNYCIRIRCIGVMKGCILGGLGLRALGTSGSGFWVWGLELKAWGLGLRVAGLGPRAYWWLGGHEGIWGYGE